MALRDLSAYLEDSGLELPVDGKVYSIPSPDPKTGLWLTAMINVGLKVSNGGEATEEEISSLVLDDQEEQSFYQRVLGSALDEMIEDKVDWVKITRLAKYAAVFFALGPEQADEALEGGLLTGEWVAPNRQTRRANSRAASRGGANKTKKASTGGTTSSPAKSRSKKASA